MTYLPDRDAVVWSIKQFHGSREYLMRAHFGLPSIGSGERDDSWKKPISVKFEIPYFTVSGIQVRFHIVKRLSAPSISPLTNKLATVNPKRQVRYLKIIEKSGYQALPWVRYITQNGNYSLRMA